MRANLNNDCSSDEDSLDCPKKGVSNYKILQAHSSDFYDFVDNDPHFYYFFTCLVKEDVLERAESGIPNEALGGSEHSQTVSHANARSTHDGVIEEPNDGTMKKNPLTQVFSQFTTVMNPIVMPHDSNHNVSNNTPSMTEIKETALNVAIKSMVESSKMAEASKDKID